MALYDLHNWLFISVNRCGTPNELTALIGSAGKAGDTKATMEVTNGRGDLTVAHRKIDVVNHIISLKNLIGKLLLN